MIALALGSILMGSPLQLRTAAHHPMQYYVSLPDGWKSGHSWPVAMVIESADRDFEANAQVFEKARGPRPFIIVAPLVVTNGGANVRGIPTYHYGPAVWDQIEKDPWKFDSDGIAAVVEDVHRLYGGTTSIDITGWEAGCHTVWALMFNQPELISRAALVCPNFAGRWLKPSSSTHHPIAEVLAGENDPAWSAGKPLFDQTQRGIAEAKRRGFGDIRVKVVPGQGHGPLAGAVFDFFNLPIDGR
jgi:dienelactone hydrolase